MDSIRQFIHETGNQAGWTCHDSNDFQVCQLTLYSGSLSVFTVSITDGHRTIYNRPYHEYRKFDTFAELKDHIESRLESLKHHYGKLALLDVWLSISRLADILNSNIKHGARLR